MRSNWTEAKIKLLGEIVIDEVKRNRNRKKKRVMKDIYTIASLALANLHTPDSCQLRFNTEVRPTLTEEQLRSYGFQIRSKPELEQEPEVIEENPVQQHKILTQSPKSVALYNNAVSKIGDAIEALIDDRLQMETLVEQLLNEQEELVIINSQLAVENLELKKENEQLKKHKLGGHKNA